jgi:hypothetical protein
MHMHASAQGRVLREMAALHHHLRQEGQDFNAHVSGPAAVAMLVPLYTRPTNCGWHAHLTRSRPLAGGDGGGIRPS